jgi:hypothetical protein
VSRLGPFGVLDRERRHLDGERTLTGGGRVERERTERTSALRKRPSTSSDLATSNRARQSASARAS